MRPLEAVREELVAVLHRVRELGFLGPKPVDGQLDHAVAFAHLVDRLASLQAATPDSGGRLPSLGADPHRVTIVDLGSGGGLPGLVIAAMLPDVAVVFVDSSQKRMAVLHEHLLQLRLTERCAIVCARAEEFARTGTNRAHFDMVVARGFAGPAVTAECAAPLLRTGGYFVVSDAPDESIDRWPVAGLARVGLREAERVHAPFHFFVASQSERCSEVYPRRVGIPEKRPLF